MKITAITTFVVDAGWRPWQCVAVRTDEGLTGYGECSTAATRTASSARSPTSSRSRCAATRAPWSRCTGTSIASRGRARAESPRRAIAGIELALWELKRKALGVPVHELFGGPVRERQRLYWSHCGSSRAQPRADRRASDRLVRHDRAPRRWASRRAISALKTNVVIPGTPARTHGFGGGPTDQTVPVEILRAIERLLAAFTEGVGPDVEIALDLNFHYKPEAAVTICRVSEQLNMLWGEVDMYEPHGLRRVKGAHDRADHARREPVRDPRLPPVLRGARDGQRHDRHPVERLRAIATSRCSPRATS